MSSPFGSPKTFPSLVPYDTIIILNHLQQLLIKFRIFHLYSVLRTDVPALISAFCVECGVSNAECGVWSVECGVWSVECAIDRPMTMTTTSLESLSTHVQLQQFAWHVYVEIYVKVYVQLYITLCDPLLPISLLGALIFVMRLLGALEFVMRYF